MRFGLSVALIVAVLAGCGRNDTATVSTPDGNAAISTSSDNRTVTVNGPNGAAQITTGAGAGAAAAAELPNFLALYPGAKVTTSFAAPDGTTKGGSISFETNASPAEVIAFYKQKASAQGLREALNAADGDTQTYMATKDQTILQVIAAKGASSTDVVLSWAIPK